jgi:hypothetical protein
MKLHPGLHLQLEGEDPGAGAAFMLGSAPTTAPPSAGSSGRVG